MEIAVLIVKEENISTRTVIIAGIIMFVGFLGIMGLVALASSSAQSSALALKSRSTNTEEMNPDSPTDTPFENTSVAESTLPPLRIAFTPMISPEDAYVKYKKFVEVVAAALGRRGELIVRGSYQEINTLVAEGGCDMALVCTSSYIHLKREHGAKLLVAAIVDGKFSYQSFVIVRKDSNFHTIEDLAGHSLAYDDDTSTTGWLFPAVALQNRGKDPTTYFSKRLQVGSNDTAVSAVLNGEVNAAAVSSIVFEGLPEILRRDLRIILRSPAFAMPPMITPKGTGEELREALLNVITSLHETQTGQEVLKDLRIDRILPVYDEMYQSVEDLVDQWESK